MDPLLQQILGASPLMEQQSEADQQIADLIARRKVAAASPHSTPGGALFGGLANIIMGNKEGELRAQKADLARQMAGVRGDWGQAWTQANRPEQAPPEMIAAPGVTQATVDRDRQQKLAGLRTSAMLSGDPLLSGYVKQAPQMEMEDLNTQKTREEMTAQNSSQAGAATRILLKKYGIDLPETTPSATLRYLLPTAEKGYAAEQSKEARLEAARISAGARVTASGNGPGGPTDPKAIAQAIINGEQPPDLTGMYRQGPAIRSELARQHFDLGAAQQEWQATKKHLASLNGTQQERLRQAVDFTSHSLDTIEGLYQDWKAVGAATGIKSINKVTLAAAKALPGDAGAAAQALEAQINDLTAELANVYMGGNSPTDHALKLAASNLSANWNEETLNRSLKLIRTNLALRRNAMTNSQTAGGSRYDRKPAAAASGAGSAPAPAASGPVKIGSDAEFDALPSGTVFIGPDGKQRKKP